MKNKSIIQYDPEGFYFDNFKRMPFCVPPQKNYQINAIIFENIMDQFDYLEDLQNNNVYIEIYELLKYKNCKYSGLLAIEVFNQ